MAAQFRLLIKNDQWLILGAVIAIIMFGGIIRNSVAAYYAKYYLNGGDALISPFLTSGVIASVLAMIACTAYSTLRQNKNISLYPITGVRGGWCDVFRATKFYSVSFYILYCGDLSD